MTHYLLDTDICLELLRGRAPGVYERLRRLAVDQVGLSSIILAELTYGAAARTSSGAAGGVLRPGGVETTRRIVRELPEILLFGLLLKLYLFERLLVYAEALVRRCR